MGLESRIINSDNFRIMNIKKVGVAIEYCTYDKMKAKNGLTCKVPCLSYPKIL